MQQNQIERIINKLDEHSEILTRLDVAVNGNGTPGINDRLKTVEKVQLGHTVFIAGLSAVGVFLSHSLQFINSWMQGGK